MVMERQGKKLRILEPDLSAEAVAECVRFFAADFKRGGLLPAVKRIVVKEYPDAVGTALEQAGFMKEMQDYVLYR